MSRKWIFQVIRFIVIKYFKEALKPIYGTGSMAGIPIVWKWTFIDRDYEKILKNHKPLI